VTRRFILLSALLSAHLAGAEPKGGASPKRTLRARLIAPVEDPVRVRDEQGDEYVLELDVDGTHTLHDPILVDRMWEFEGRRTPEGRFEVSKMFTIKDGVRHKVTYYCEVCHIVSFRPGLCMCCQDDVALQETAEQE